MKVRGGCKVLYDVEQRVSDEVDPIIVLPVEFLFEGKDDEQAFHIFLDLVYATGMPGPQLG